VPEVLAAYEREDGSFVLETKLIDGVEMNDLSRQQRNEVKPQIRQCVERLHSLHSNRLGGPSGIIWPPHGVATPPDGPTSWSQTTNFESERPFVFCHRDLSQSNIFIDPTTLELTGIIDWECEGYYPEDHELPFFETSTRSGVQVKTISGMAEIKRFWETSSLLKTIGANNSTSSPLGSDSDLSNC
jgi:serine/threonine protein kinase